MKGRVKRQLKPFPKKRILWEPSRQLFCYSPCNLEVTWHHYAYKKCYARSGDLIGGHGMTTRRCKRFVLKENQIFLKFVKSEGGEDYIFLICPKLSQMLKETFFSENPKIVKNYPNLTRKHSRGPANLKLSKTSRFIIIRHVEKKLYQYLC